MLLSIKQIDKRFFLRELIIALILLFVYNNYMLKKVNVINADGRGYYEYLPALFIYNDIHFNYLDTLVTDYYDAEQIKEYYKTPKFEHRVDKYFVGTSILQSPFFVFAHVKTKFFQKEFKPDGFSKPYQRAILLAALCYLILGFIFIRRLLETYEINGWGIFFMQLSIMFCTSLFTYTMYDSAYSHVYSFALISGFLWAVRKFFLTEKSKYILWTLFLLGLIVVVRPVNILVLLFIPFLADSWRELLFKIGVLFQKKWKYLLVGMGLFFIVLCSQFYISYLQTGNPFNYNYGDEKFIFSEAHFIDFLFSYRKGFFLWSPWWLMTFIVGVLFWMKEKNGYHLMTFLGAFVIVVYVFSSWESWAYGGSHGSRPMVDFYGAFALLAVPIFTSGKKLVYYVFFILSIPLAVVNLIQSVQYQKAILFWDRMDKEKYWKVFLNTNDKYTWYFWREQISVGKQQSEIVLFENVKLQPTDSYEIKDLAVNTIDSLSLFGEFIVDLDREADNEYMELRMYDSLGNQLWYDLQRLFYRQEGNQVIYKFVLPDEKLKVKTIGITFRNVSESLNIKKATFSTHYSLN